MSTEPLLDARGFLICKLKFACYNPAPMPPYSNLVSDSTLVQETLDLLRVSGGRANASQIVDVVFKVSHIDAELAGLLVGDLVKDDRRFKIIDGQTVELQLDDCESRLLIEIDFVVVDVEATGAKMPPNRIIELGAYRISRREDSRQFYHAGESRDFYPAVRNLLNRHHQ